MKFSPAKQDAHVNIYALSWKNPYGDEHRIKAQPKPTRAQRLATVMRVIGRPLSIMRNWPEVRALKNTPSETVERSDKPQSMAEQKAIAAHRAALEKSIERLAAQRDPLKAKLESIESELKTLLSMLKAAGPVAGEEDEAMDPDAKKPRRTKAEAQKAYGEKLNGRKLSPHAATALKMLTKAETITPAELAEKTGQSGAAASQTLAVLAKAGSIVKLKRGTFGPVAS